MSNRQFVYPGSSLKQHRNKFKMPYTVKTSFNHGLLIPLGSPIEVLPGDTMKLNIASLIRMSTPIAPLMDNITMHVAAYFIPWRILYEHTEEMFGANKTGAWTDDEVEYGFPVCTDSIQGGTIEAGTIGDYLGLPLTTNADFGGLNALPGRAYYTIWNEFYRSQVVSAPVPVSHGTGDVLVDDITIAGVDCLAGGYDSFPLPLGKYADLFTKCLPQPQKGGAVPFVGDLTFNDEYAFISRGVDQLDDEPANWSAGDNIGTTYYGDLNTGVDAVLEPNTENLATDKAWNTINSLRFAFQLQKYLEKDARYGTRYFEYLNAHYGVRDTDMVLQRPEFLGEINFRINVDQVLSTSGYASTTGTEVGKTGANSTTTNKGWLFTKSFKEHGYVMLVMGTRADHTYGQGFDKLFSRYDKFDVYDPLFANIGDVPVLNREIFYDEDNINDGEKVFGYQEAWYEYRFIPDKCTGLLRPDAVGSLDFWTLADKFATTPVLGEQFIYENRDNIKRALVTGATGPDFIGDFYMDLTAVREMPLFSIPGLADHH